MSYVIYLTLLLDSVLLLAKLLPIARGLLTASYLIVNRYGCLAKRGQRIPHPCSGANTVVAYFNVFSESRQEALEIAAEVKREMRYSFR